jgi:mRNA-degrading endonuclease toxin of MazEF toxin-antitoxin module
VDRGDIYLVDLNPVQGPEQTGRRYVMIVSPRPFNRLGTPIVCPITQGGNFARHAGFAVSLSGAGINAQGVILCNQLRALDLQTRGAKFIEKAPDFVIEDVMARVAVLFE